MVLVCGFWVGFVANTAHAAAINYLSISVVNSSYRLLTTRPPKTEWWCGPNFSGYLPEGGPDTSATTGSINMSFTISTSVPPITAPVHYYGNAEAMVTNPSNTISTVYVAGVPSSIVVTELTTGNTTTVTAGGNPAVISVVSSIGVGTVSGIGILLPDKTILTASVTGVITQNFTPASNFDLPGAIYGYCNSTLGYGWSGTNYESGTQIIAGSASLLFGAGTNLMSKEISYAAGGSPAITGIYSKAFQQGLTVSGKTFTITDSLANTFSGTITHVIGY